MAMLPLNRRQLGGLAGLAGLAATASACAPWDQPSVSATRPADDLLVDEVVIEVRHTRDVAAAVNNEAVVAMHEAHLTALGQPTPITPSGSPSVAPVAPQDLSAAETTLNTHLTSAALRANDGGLARMLASMAAAVAQQLEVLR